MKALRLTWLHSCLFGRRGLDYRADPVLPPSLTETNTLFKETKWTRDEKAGLAGTQLLFLFCWCCCFLHRGCRLFNRCSLHGLRDLYWLSLCCCSRTQDYELQRRWTWICVSSLSSDVVAVCFLSECELNLRPPDIVLSLPLRLCPLSLKLLVKTICLSTLEITSECNRNLQPVIFCCLLKQHNINSKKS